MNANNPPSAPKVVESRAKTASISDAKNAGLEGKRPRADSKPEIDPHTLEREARNRERMLKEAQRMSVLMNRGAAAAGDGVGRRGSESTRLGGGRRGSERDKKKDRRRGSGYGDEDSESRARRVEAEREAERWG